MSDREIILFVLIWAIADRLREIAIFPGWVSRFGGWWDRFFTPSIPSWVPWRDGYHAFKNLPVLLLFVITWLVYGLWPSALAVVGAWTIGQWVGLAFRKEKE